MELASKTDQWEKELEEATAQRKKEHAEFEAQAHEYVVSMDETDEVIKTMQEANHNVAQKHDMLLQISARKNLPEATRRVIAAFVDADPENAMDLIQYGSPEAAAYQSQESGLISTMEKMKDKFREEKGQLEKEELNQENSFQLVKFDLDNQVKGANKVRADKEQRIAKKNRNIGGLQGELDDANGDLKEDSSYLRELNAECEQKHRDFEDRSKLRQGEIDAVEKAIEILNSPEMKIDGETARDQKYGLTQKGTSFAQLRSNSASPQRKAISFLMSTGHKLHSEVLSALALRCEGDVFANVKKLIKDMIHKLLEEANEEAEHKGWCDTELGTNKQTRTSKSNTVDKLEGEIEALESQIAQLNDDIGDLNDAMNGIDEAVKQAEEDRKDEHKRNKTTIAEAQEAQQAVSKAMKVLKDFYKKAGQATALVQETAAGFSDDAPESFSEPYTGMQGESGGVVGLLEAILSDLQKQESETSVEERAAEAEHKRFLAESQRDRKVKARDVEHRERQQTKAQSEVSHRKKELAGTEEELAAAERYYEKLRPSCVDEGVSHEDRMAKRQQEIDAMKEALELLNNGVDFSG
jgi:hypothetical protein